MSKKTRKKSSKKSPGKSSGAVARKAASAKPARASAKSAKTRKGSAPAKATRPTQKATRKTGSATRMASPKPPLKVLKSSSPKTAAAKPSTASQTAAVKAEAAGLVEGAKAPDFHLPRDGGGTVSLSDYAGRKLVLFFYPRADTPGCTKEAIDFTRLSGAFAEAGTALLGVSADPPKAQEAFRDKHELATPLASDEAHQMLDAYGVWREKSMYGKIFLGIVRTTVLLGADGRILRIWRNVRVDDHADEVLAAAQAS